MGADSVRVLTDTLLTQLYAQNSDDPFLTLFSLEHISWASPIYLVNNTEAVISNGTTFEAFPVRLTLPVDDGESIRTVRIQFDNVSRELIDEIRSVTDSNIRVTIQMVLASAPDVVEIEIADLKIKSIEYSDKIVSATLTLDDFLNTEIPQEKYTPTVYPGIF